MAEPTKAAMRAAPKVFEAGDTWNAMNMTRVAQIIDRETGLKELIDSAKQAMHCLTGETEDDWRKSQSYDEAPYHFLFDALRKAGAL